MILNLDIQWTTPPPGEEAGRSLGWGAGLLLVRGVPVWHHHEHPDRGVTWSWIELLEGLAVKWKYLIHEQGFPIDVPVGDPLTLREQAKRRWKKEYSSLYDDDYEDGESWYLVEQRKKRDSEDEAAFRFERAHDLSRYLNGIKLPSVAILREGSLAWVSTPHSSEKHRFDEVMADLLRIGEGIAEQIKASRDERVRKALEAWRDREVISESQRVSLATGIPVDRLDAILGSLSSWELDTDSEFAAAARMTEKGYGWEESLKTVVTAVKGCPRTDTTRLDVVSAKILSRLEGRLRDEPAIQPFEQGYDLAHWVASELDSHPGSIDPERALRSLGVSIREIRLSSSVDGLGCWGPKHGPVIFINPVGKHSQSPQGRRATLAHELCHLVVDRAGSLPLAEVLGNPPKSPIATEKRAKAFAAEFLLPRRFAKESYAKHRAVEATLKDISLAYNVSWTLAANQLYRSNANLTTVERLGLRTLLNADNDPDFDLLDL